MQKMLYSEISSASLYFLTMRRGRNSRRIVISVLCILISVFTIIRFYDGRYSHLPAFSSESQIHDQACRIWPKWSASDRGNLRYGDYNSKEARRLPSVGDASVLGNPDICLKVESRLDIYRMASTEEYDWNTVQWGEHCRLVYVI